MRQVTNFSDYESTILHRTKHFTLYENGRVHHDSEDEKDLSHIEDIQYAERDLDIFTHLEQSELFTMQRIWEQYITENGY